MNKEYLELVAAAQSQRLQLTNDQIASIKKMYEEIWFDLRDKMKNTPASSFNGQWVRDYRKHFRSEINKLNDLLEGRITESMEQSAQFAADIQKKMFEVLDDYPTMAQMFYRVPTEVVNELVSGGFYKDGKGLSKRIWSNKNRANADFDYIIEKGIAAKKPFSEIVEDLSKYVNPNAKRDMNFKNIYPKIGNKKIDYNAFRLAVTSISHAYQLSMQRSCAKNPFVEGIQWHTSNSHRGTCSQCRDRDGVIYKSHELPLDHPNGICYFTPVVEKSMDEIGNELRNWINGGENPTLDKWYAENGGTEVKKVKKEENSSLDFSGMQRAFKSKRLGKLWSDEVEPMIKDSPEFMQKWFAKYGDHLKFDNTCNKSTAYYSPSTGGITMHVRNDAKDDRCGRYSTFFHEFGHLLDHVSAKDKGVKKISGDARFINAIKEDYNDRLNTPLFKGKPAAFVNGKLTDLLWEAGDLAGGVQDMYSGLTLNKVRPCWGHSTEYWLRGDTDKEIASEAFAHMASSFTNPQILEKMKEWFPKSCDVFETLIKELID